MKKQNTFLNVITGIFAFIFSVMFVISSIFAVIAGAASGCITPGGIDDIVKNEEFVNAVIDYGFEEELSNAGLTDEQLEYLENSDFVSDLTGTVAEGYLAELTQLDSYEELTADDVKKIFEENSDELVEFIKDYPDNEGMTDEELKSKVLSVSEEFADELVSIVDEVSESITESDKNDIEKLKYLISGDLALALSIISFICLLVICALRFPHTFGFLWAGVTCIVSAVLVFLSVCGADIIMNMSDVPDDMTDLVFPIFDTFKSKMILGGVVILLVGILLIVARVYLAKKKGSAAPENTMNVPTNTPSLNGETISNF